MLELIELVNLAVVTGIGLFVFFLSVAFAILLTSRRNKENYLNRTQLHYLSSWHKRIEKK